MWWLLYIICDVVFCGKALENLRENDNLSLHSEHPIEQNTINIFVKEHNPVAWLKKVAEDSALRFNSRIE